MERNIRIWKLFSKRCIAMNANLKEYQIGWVELDSKSILKRKINLKVVFRQIFDNWQSVPNNQTKHFSTEPINIKNNPAYVLPPVKLSAHENERGYLIELRQPQYLYSSSSSKAVSDYISIPWNPYNSFFWLILNVSQTSPVFIDKTTKRWRYNCNYEKF